MTAAAGPDRAPDPPAPPGPTILISSAPSSRIARRDPPSGPVADPATCPLCGGDSRQRFLAHGYPVLVCRHCDHRFAGLVPSAEHVQTIYDDSYFDGGGAGYDDYLAEGEILTNHGRRYADLLASRAIEPGRLLDVGASCGFIMTGLSSRGWHGVGLEPNASMAARGRALSGVDIRVGTAEALPALQATQAPDAHDESDALHRPPEGSFDLISMIQVIAHFHDLRLAFDNLRARTNPGGHWLIETWDHGSLSARLAGRHWHEYSPPSVLRWFTRKRLTALLAEYGMRPVAHGRPRKFLRGSHARSLLAHQLGESRPGRLLLPLTRAIPESLAIPYPADDLFWLLCRRD